MATDGPTPLPCDPEIFQNGQPVAAIDGHPNAVECWVQKVALKAHARLDWHYSGGIAQVLHLGDAKSSARVYAAIEELKPMLKGTIMRIYTPGEKGLYRASVTQAPPDAVAGFMDPLTAKRPTW